MIQNSNIRNKILTFYKENKRQLPWRTIEDNNQNPYYTLVSEYMLQQTQVKTALKYFHAFIKKWPKIENLASANEEEVLTIWSGLGYYNRAKNLLKTAKIIKKEYKGIIPSQKESLLKLPGIGIYTAAAIRSFSFGKHEVVLDTNIKRFIFRIYGIHERYYKEKNMLETYGNKLFPKNNTGKFAQAIMDFSSEICKKKNPKCNNCILNDYCKYYKTGNLKDIKEKKIKKNKRFSLFYFHIFKEKYFFLKKRSSGKILGDLYEVPCSEWQENNWPKIEKKYENKTLVPQIFEYKFSHFSLYGKIILINVRKKKKLENNGIWITTNNLNTIPISSLTKKIINYSLK